MEKSDKQQRKLAREAVLQALYAKHVSNEEGKKVLHDIFIRYEFDKMTKKFVEELFNLTIKFSLFLYLILFQIFLLKYPTITPYKLSLERR